LGDISRKLFVGSGLGCLSWRQAGVLSRLLVGRRWRAGVSEPGVFVVAAISVVRVNSVAVTLSVAVAIIGDRSRKSFD
jgi:hypothetical protein